MGPIDYMLLALLAALAVAAVWWLRRRGSSCGGCSGCPMAGQCPKKKK